MKTYHLPSLDDPTPDEERAAVARDGLDFTPVCHADLSHSPYAHKLIREAYRDWVSGRIDMQRYAHIFTTCDIYNPDNEDEFRVAESKREDQDDNCH